MQFDLRVGREPAQCGQCAMLALAEPKGLCTGEGQRIAPSQLRPRPRTHQRLLELGKRWVPVVKQRFRVQLDLARRGVESTSDAVGHGREFSMLGFQPQADSAGGRAEALERHTARAELVAVGGIDVSVPEMVSQAEPSREVEDDLNVGARLTAWRDERLSKLNQ